VKNVVKNHSACFIIKKEYGYVIPVWIRKEMDITQKIDILIVEKSVKQLEKEIQDLRKGDLTSVGKEKLKKLEDELFVKKLG